MDLNAIINDGLAQLKEESYVEEVVQKHLKKQSMTPSKNHLEVGVTLGKN